MVVLLVSLARRAYHFQQLASSSTPFHECRTYYLNLGLSLRGKVDAENKAGTTVTEYMNGTPNWRTDLYSTASSGTLMSHKDSIQLFSEMGVKMTPELKSPTVIGPLPEGNSQQDYAQKLVDEYREAGIEPSQVWLQSFRYDDVLYWLNHAPEFAAGVVYLHSSPDVLTTHHHYDYWRSFFDGVKADGVNTVAPPITALLTHDGQKITATQYAYAARDAGLDIVAWTLENTGPLKENDNFYLSSIREVLQNDGDAMVMLDVLAQDIGVKAVFTDWAGTTTYYASCMGLK